MKTYGLGYVFAGAQILNGAYGLLG